VDSAQAGAGVGGGVSEAGPPAVSGGATVVEKGSTAGGISNEVAPRGGRSTVVEYGAGASGDGVDVGVTDGGAREPEAPATTAPAAAVAPHCHRSAESVP